MQGMAPYEIQRILVTVHAEISEGAFNIFLFPANEPLTEVEWSCVCKMIETMHHLTRARYILATFLICVACTFSMAQYGDFGLPEQPG